MILVLQTDISGTPQDWLTPEDAATVICDNRVAWSSGPTAAILRGGISRCSGYQSVLEIPAIIGTRGRPKGNQADRAPTLGASNHKLFTRDKCLCAYCATQYSPSVLTREHVLPKARGGADTWTNVVTACKSCNGRKACRTPEEAGMPLVYLPYEPNLFEDFILQRGGRKILEDQMAYLLARAPAKSRLRN